MIAKPVISYLTAPFIYIIGHLRAYWQAEKNIPFVLVWGSFVAICVAINYYFDFETNYIESIKPYWLEVLAYILMYSFAFYGGLFLYSIFYKKFSFWKDALFWVKTLFALSFFSIYVSFNTFYSWIQANFPYEIQYFLMKCAANVVRPVGAALVLLIVWIFTERSKSHFYGMSTKKIDLKPYFWILSIMLPLIVIASFTSDFQQTYPRYRPSLAEGYLGWPFWKTSIIFELCYGVDFVFIELFFRGFLMMAFARWLGIGALAAMVPMYVFIHFQKPLGETIGSFFGGWILGVMAYRTESIWGGVIAHLGVAWLMELTALAHLDL
ncbi:MAG: CPBP family intramembrane metalloprotease [Bacteroidia bacterium]|nr:CPBP family intramembrane metalloprotease [Bacteroidia bacterium]